MEQLSSIATLPRSALPTWESSLRRPSSSLGDRGRLRCMGNACSHCASLFRVRNCPATLPIRYRLVHPFQKSTFKRMLEDFITCVKSSKDAGSSMVLLTRRAPHSEAMSPAAASSLDFIGSLKKQSLLKFKALRIYKKKKNVKYR